MSERYGPCPTCAGAGEIKIYEKREEPQPDGTSRDLIVLVETRECGRCEGTGFDGDAMNFLDWRRSQS